jgi:hypothetical protein
MFKINVKNSYQCIYSFFLIICLQIVWFAAHQRAFFMISSLTYKVPAQSVHPPVHMKLENLEWIFVKSDSGELYENV